MLSGFFLELRQIGQIIPGLYGCIGRIGAISGGRRFASSRLAYMDIIVRSTVDVSFFELKLLECDSALGVCELSASEDMGMSLFRQESWNAW